MAVSSIRTSAASRAAYLARATIWRDPGALSAADVLAGPPGALPYTFEQATSDAGIAIVHHPTAGGVFGGQSTSVVTLDFGRR